VVSAVEMNKGKKEQNMNVEREPEPSFQRIPRAQQRVERERESSDER
jgi:hypothetical protein